MIFIHIHAFKFSIAIAQLIVFFSFAHVQMFCAINQCDRDSKEWYFLPFKWLPKTFVCDTNKNVTKMGVIIKAIYCSNQVLVFKIYILKTVRVGGFKL
jgi:hypothetical protein